MPNNRGIKGVVFRRIERKNEAPLWMVDFWTDWWVLRFSVYHRNIGGFSLFYQSQSFDMDAMETGFAVLKKSPNIKAGDEIPVFEMHRWITPTWMQYYYG